MLDLEKEEAYFINSIDSDATRKNYEYCMSRFLKYCNLDLESLLKLPQQELSNLIIKYLVPQKISSQYRVTGFKLIPKSAAVTFITVLITILVSKVVRLKMMTYKTYVGFTTQ